MKKQLGLIILGLCLLFTSCTHNNENISQKSYNEFINLFQEKYLDGFKTNYEWYKVEMHYISNNEETKNKREESFIGYCYLDLDDATVSAIDAIYSVKEYSKEKIVNNKSINYYLYENHYREVNKDKTSSELNLVISKGNDNISSTNLYLPFGLDILENEIFDFDNNMYHVIYSNEHNILNFQCNDINNPITSSSTWNYSYNFTSNFDIDKFKYSCFKTYEDYLYEFAYLRLERTNTHEINMPDSYLLDIYRDDIKILKPDSMSIYS